MFVVWSKTQTRGEECGGAIQASLPSTPAQRALSATSVQPRRESKVPKTAELRGVVLVKWLERSPTVPDSVSSSPDPACPFCVGIHREIQSAASTWVLRTDEYRSNQCKVC